MVHANSERVSLPSPDPHHFQTLYLIHCDHLNRVVYQVTANWYASDYENSYCKLKRTKPIAAIRKVRGSFSNSKLRCCSFMFPNKLGWILFPTWILLSMHKDNLYVLGHKLNADWQPCKKIHISPLITGTRTNDSMGKQSNTLLIRMDHYFWPKFAKLDPSESGPASKIWAKNNGPF